MKRIAFIGTIANRKRSSQLFNLFNESRIYNSEHNIKGIFLVSDNTVLQILEGEGDKVSKAVYYARRDDKFDYFGIIINTDIEKAYLSTWPMRFVKNDSPSHNSFKKKLSAALASQVVFNNDNERNLYNSIFQQNGKITNIPSSNTKKIASNPSSGEPGQYLGLTLSLAAWPKPTQIRMTPQAIKTCSLISRGYIDYSVLVSKGIWANETQLDTFLNALHQCDLLLMQNCQTSGSKADTSQSGDRFSQLLKKFITSPKHQIS